LHRPNRACIVLAVASLLIVSASVAPIGAEAGLSAAKSTAKGFPDNADIRGKLFAYVIGASRDAALAYGEKQLASAAGTVTVRVEKRSVDFIVEFLNASASGDAGRGSCFIQRSNAKGNYILQARILLEDDPSCYLSLYPSGSGTRGDIVMYGAIVKKGLYLSDMIYRILLLSFSDIVDSTSRSFNWSLVFNFEADDPGYASELRDALASAASPSEQEPLASVPASAASIAVGSPTSRVALAAAPSLPSPGTLGDPVKGPRSLRISSSVDRAASPEALIMDLATLGESGARELSIAADSAPPYVDDKGDPFAKPAYAAFPRYDGKGLPFAALRAALYLDLQANPASVYALIGEGLRATVIPSFDEGGALEFAVFSGGKESSWRELSEGRRDLKARIVRVPSVISTDRM
jgi:hypothetical protein